MVRDALTEVGMIVGGIIATVLLTALLIAGCGTNESASRAQSGPVASVICTYNGFTTFNSPILAAVRTTYPFPCPSPPGGIWARATNLAPFPSTNPATVVAMQGTDEIWYLIDDRYCTGLPPIPLPTEGCPADMPCFRGLALPCL